MRQPSSAIERIFSILKFFLNIDQDLVLEDYTIELSLMVQYNKKTKFCFHLKMSNYAF